MRLVRRHHSCHAPWANSEMFLTGGRRSKPRGPATAGSRLPRGNKRVEGRPAQILTPKSDYEYMTMPTAVPETSVLVG